MLDGRAKAVEPEFLQQSVEDDGRSLFRMGDASL